MSLTWEMVGVPIATGSNQAFLTAKRGARRIRQAKHETAGGVVRQHAGLEMQSADIDITFVGTGGTKFDSADDILSILDDDEVWTLSAPASVGNAYAWRNNKRAAFSTEDWQLDESGLPARLVVKVQANVEGIWIADGGDYCEELSGFFTFDGADYFSGDGTNVGSAPLLEVPEQTPGYPKAIRASDFALVEVTALDSTRVDNDVVFETYDMTGFLVPTPTATRGGSYQLCSSPTAAFLDDEGLASTGATAFGLTEFALARGMVAE